MHGETLETVNRLVDLLRKERTFTDAEIYILKSIGMDQELGCFVPGGSSTSDIWKAGYYSIRAKQTD